MNIPGSQLKGSGKHSKTKEKHNQRKLFFDLVNNNEDGISILIDTEQFSAIKSHIKKINPSKKIVAVNKQKETKGITREKLNEDIDTFRNLAKPIKGRLPNFKEYYGEIVDYLSSNDEKINVMWYDGDSYVSKTKGLNGFKYDTMYTLEYCFDNNRFTDTSSILINISTYKKDKIKINEDLKLFNKLEKYALHRGYKLTKRENYLYRKSSMYFIHYDIKKLSPLELTHEIEIIQKNIYDEKLLKIKQEDIKNLEKLVKTKKENNKLMKKYNEYVRQFEIVKERHKMIEEELREQNDKLSEIIDGYEQKFFALDDILSNYLQKNSNIDRKNIWKMKSILNGNYHHIHELERYEENCRKDGIEPYQKMPNGSIRLSNILFDEDSDDSLSKEAEMDLKRMRDDDDDEKSLRMKKRRKIDRLALF